MAFKIALSFEEELKKEFNKRTVSIEQYQKLKKQVDLNTKDIHELRLKIG